MSSAPPLDLLHFLRPPLTARLPARKVDTSVYFRAHASQRKVQFAVPFMLRSPKAQHWDKLWPEFCSRLGQLGIPVRCPATELSEVPPASVPLRVAVRRCAEAFQLEELHTADLIELDGRHTERNRIQWHWPTELSRTEQLAPLIESVRAAAGGNSPVGIVLPEAANTSDLQAAKAAKADFITLVCTTSRIDTALVWSLVQAREICCCEGEPQLPIILDAPVTSAEDAVKCMALGATVVGIDGILAPHVPRPESKPTKPSHRSLLTELGAQAHKTDSVIDRIVQTLQHTIDEVVDWHAACGAARVGELDASMLRAATTDLAHLCQLSEWPAPTRPPTGT